MSEADTSPNVGCERERERERPFIYISYVSQYDRCAGRSEPRDCGTARGYHEIKF